MFERDLRQWAKNQYVEPYHIDVVVAEMSVSGLKFDSSGMYVQITIVFPPSPWTDLCEEHDGAIPSYSSRALSKRYFTFLASHGLILRCEMRTYNQFILCFAFRCVLYTLGSVSLVCKCLYTSYSFPENQCMDVL